jgi:3-hydroxyisobutyrate dehydrogenase
MKVAWIGLGNMGTPMAANLVKAGFEVVGFDLSAAAVQHAVETGVATAGSAVEAATGADVLVTMLPAGKHVRSVLLGTDGTDGVLSVLAPGATVIDSSTIDLATARELHQLIGDAGFGFLDAPVSGGTNGAQAGTLTYMIGGDSAVLEKVRPVIEAMSGKIFHLGGGGNGQAAKLANNLMLGINTVALAEGATLAARMGLDAATFFEMAKASSGDSWALRTWYPVPGVVETAAVNRDFEGGFAIGLMRKDVGLAVEAADDLGVSLPFARKVITDLDAMTEAGWGAKDSASLVKLYDGTVAQPES